MEKQSTIVHKMNHIFPVAIGEYTYQKNINEEELNLVKNLDKKPNHEHSVSVDRYVLDNYEQLKEIREFCYTSVKHFFQETYQPTEDVELYITQSWMNYNEPNQFHHRHVHPNSIISGVFYFQCIPGYDKIYFYKNIPYSRIQVATNNFNLYNSTAWWFQCTAGALYLFDSSVDHAVDVNKSSITRISLAFNTFVKGKLGLYDESTYLVLE
jgi:uncharacterized protein (TIGR02466 family)